MKNKYRLFLAVLLLCLLILSGCAKKTSTASNKPVTLTVYGLDNSDVFDPIIAAYKEKQPAVTVKYKKFVDRSDFEELIVNEIAEGEGPDIFYIHNSWLPKNLKKIVPLDSTSYTPETFNANFVSVAESDFVQPDPVDGTQKIYAMPLFVDTLALYYNKDLFEQFAPERGRPGATWAEVKQDAQKFKKLSSDNTLMSGEIALGTADTISYAVEALYNFWLQAGLPFYDDGFKQVKIVSGGEKGFLDYLSFADSESDAYSFNDELVSSGSKLKEVEAFLTGKVATIMGFSDLYYHLENDLKNVKTDTDDVISFKDIAVAPIPQLSSETNDAKVLASYSGLAVSRNSKSPQLAWDFIAFATSQEQARTFYKETKHPAARRDLIEEQKKDPITKVFVDQVGFADSYRIYDYGKFAAVLKDALRNTQNGQTPRSALGQAQNSMNEILKAHAPEGIYIKPKVKKK